MKKIVTLSEALQKWADGRSIEVSLNIKLLTLEDLQWLDDMGAVFSYEVADQNPGVKEPAITIESPWEQEDSSMLENVTEVSGVNPPPRSRGTERTSKETKAD